MAEQRKTDSEVSAADVLQKHGWNLYFAHFPNFDNPNRYRIYKVYASTNNTLLGCGKTPDEAIQAALTADVDPAQTGAAKP